MNVQLIGFFSTIKPINYKIVDSVIFLTDNTYCDIVTTDIRKIKLEEWN